MEAIIRIADEYPVKHESKIENRKLRTLRFLSCVFCLTFALIPGCSLFDQKEDNVVIVVGSRQITTDELSQDMKFISSGMDMLVLDNDRIRDELIERVIDHYLILEYGKQKKISLSEEELESALKEITKEYTEDRFQEALLRGYSDFEQWKNQLKEQLLVDKIITRVSERIVRPSRQDIEQYFEKNKDEFRSPPMVRFMQIVTRNREQTHDLLKQLHNGEDMSSLARKYSTGPEAENGGEVGWVALGSLHESMEEVIFSMAPGKISPVVKTPYGFHIFKVLSVRQGGMKELGEVHQEIESSLLEQRREVFINKWLQELRTHFEVTVNLDQVNKLELS